MKRGMLLAVVVGVAGMAGTLARAATAAIVGQSGVCVLCHAEQVAVGVETGGHAAGLDCVACHGDRRPGRVGRRHRAVPRCASCHQGEVNHPPRARRVKAMRGCLACHDVHGSRNLSLVGEMVRAPRRRTFPVRFTTAEGAAPGGFTDPTAPGQGVCETCHGRTTVYRADGHGEIHFTVSCTLCHEHARAFAPVAVRDETCGLCHPAQALRFAKPSLHLSTFGVCSGCHEERAAAAGPGHRRVSACTDCHDTATLAPAGLPAFPCTQCHDPHGTDNLSLVLEAIPVPQGGTRPIAFDNLLGRTEGSFASASAPGTGICEICHTKTRFYRADGSGESHFTFSCLACHPHETGFVPAAGTP